MGVSGSDDKLVDFVGDYDEISGKRGWSSQLDGTRKRLECCKVVEEILRKYKIVSDGDLRRKVGGSCPSFQKWQVFRACRGTMDDLTTALVVVKEVR